MKNSIGILIVVFSFLLVGLVANAGDDKDYHHLTPYKGTPEFEKMKSLIGTWKGTTKMGEEEKEIIVTYNTASADSIIIEKMFPETPQEMVSVYYDEDGKLSMTHYCALKNQPHMKLEDSKDNSIKLSFLSGSNLDHKKDPHMHSLSIEFIDNNQIVHNWTMYDNGKVKEVSSFSLSRAN